MSDLSFSMPMFQELYRKMVEDQLNDREQKLSFMQKIAKGYEFDQRTMTFNFEAIRDYCGSLLTLLSYKQLGKCMETKERNTVIKIAVFPEALNAAIKKAIVYNFRSPYEVSNLYNFYKFAIPNATGKGMQEIMLKTMNEEKIFEADVVESWLYRGFWEVDPAKDMDKQISESIASKVQLEAENLLMSDKYEAFALSCSVIDQDIARLLYKLYLKL